MSLANVMELKTLQEIQNCFTEATGFAAIAVDYKGRPLLQFSNFSKFCSKLREHPYYSEKCNRSDAIGSIEGARRGSYCIYRCHAGLIDFAIPIMVDGEYIASMMCGQVLAADDSDEIEVIMKSSDNIFSDHPELLELYKQIPVIPYKKIKETAKLLYLTMNYITQMHVLNEKNITLLKDQAKSLELENQFKDLELRFYNSQIYPHFLFNALNIAGRQAYLENAKKTQDIIYALADTYRGFLQDTRILINVEEELMNIKNYIYIQHMRFGDLLKFENNIGADFLKYKLPRMTLQIFIENAIRHGLETKEDFGTVWLSCEIKDEKLHFTIKDNGVGMSQSLVHSLNSKKFPNTKHTNSTGLGIYYAHKRLEYFYSGEYQIQFESEMGSGTRVLMTIPASF
jgi:sensor histidine kinase YesM